ncbi:MAG: hypothetical protein EBZ69_05840 [Alphaproteobacteria bacterium]|nr:hypothetical protein [Alphaproteobacteria bacterium]NDG04980.1 hypothetical protein [Alphaproteobacteria bacterium]
MTHTSSNHKQHSKKLAVWPEHNHSTAPASCHSGTRKVNILLHAQAVIWPRWDARWYGCVLYSRTLGSIGPEIRRSIQNPEPNTPAATWPIDYQSIKCEQTPEAEGTPATAFG